jgi:CBS domain-containing protein
VSPLPLRVSDFMSQELLTVTPDTEITRVVQLLIDNDVSGLMVVDDEGALLGILTERDCVAAATSAGYYDVLGGPAALYMSSPVETVSSNDNLVDIAIRMARSPFRRFPVVDGGRLVGLISRRDVLRALGSGSWFTKQG